MNILVCVKQVPDVSQVEIDRETNNLKRDGVKSIVNPSDLNALQAALEIKRVTEGKVTVISMGPPQADEAIKECLAIGADDGYVICDQAFIGSDTLATSYVLSQAAKKLGDFDLVFTGTNSIDGDTGQVGPELAELLGINQATYVKSLEINEENRSVSVTRDLEFMEEKAYVQLPALFSIIRDSNFVNSPSRKKLIQLKKEEIKILTAKDLDCDENRIGMKGSATVVSEIYPPEEVEKGQFVEGSVDEQVDKVIEILANHELIK
ncbi:electron transfer flavoprotein subunit beta/FixA family protein [Peptoniphilus sp. GNH]|nr:electron transfer flavoprotein subunit beta/FixA family protein [Peptoniphilus sp. GNH]